MTNTTTEDTCRFRNNERHVCRDRDGNDLPAGSPKVCWTEARTQIREQARG